MNAQSTSQKSCELTVRDRQDPECIRAISIQALLLPIEERARAHLSNCPYAFCFKNIQLEFAGGVLTLRGRLSTFYLKQILQTWLRNVDGVNQIDNQVDVVSALGLKRETGSVRV